MPTEPTPYDLENERKFAGSSATRRLVNSLRSAPGLPAGVVYAYAHTVMNNMAALPDTRAMLGAQGLGMARLFEVMADDAGLNAVLCSTCRMLGAVVNCDSHAWITAQADRITELVDALDAQKASA